MRAAHAILHDDAVAPPTRRAGPTDLLSLAARALVVAAGLLLAWRLLGRLHLFVTFNHAVLDYPWTIDRDEGVAVNSAYMLSRGHDPYGYDPAGFIATPYPPVLTAVGAIALRLGGLSLLGGRLFALAGTLATATLAGLLVARESGSRAAGLLSGALFLALGPTIVWAALYKQDLPALAFGLAGLCWLARWPDGRRVYGAVPWFALAFFTKQTAVAPLVAAGLYLLWRDWRTAARFALACAGALGLPFLALDLVTHHGFWRQVVEYHAFPWQGTLFVKRLRFGLDYHRALAPLAGLGALVGIARRPPALAGLYALTGAIALVGNGTVGANYNHLLEPLLGCCLAVGLLAGWLLRRWRRPAAALALAVVLIALCWQAPRLGAPSAWFDAHYLPNDLRAARLDQVAKMVAGAHGDVYSDDDYLLLRAGKTPRYQDDASMGPLATAGRWDPAPFLRDLQARRFALVVLNADVTRPDFASTSWPPPFRQALLDNYRLLYRDAMFTYVPR